MDATTLMGRYIRLGRELLGARVANPANEARVERLLQDVLEAEREIALRGPHDEQCDESLLSCANVILPLHLSEGLATQRGQAAQTMSCSLR